MESVLKTAAGVFIGNLALSLLAWAVFMIVSAETAKRVQAEAEQQALTSQIERYTAERHAREAQEAAEAARTRNAR